MDGGRNRVVMAPVQKPICLLQAGSVFSFDHFDRVEKAHAITGLNLFFTFQTSAGSIHVLGSSMD